MFHPLAVNFVAGMPFYHNLPEDCIILKVANSIAEQLKDAVLSYCPIDKVIYPFLYEDARPLESKQKNCDIPSDEDISWEDSWACPDPEPAPLPPPKPPSRAQLKLTTEFIKGAETSSSRRAPNDALLSRQANRSKVQMSSHSIGRSSFKPTPIPRSITSLANGPFQPFKPPEPKIKLIDPTKEPNPLLVEQNNIAEAKQRQREKNKEEKALAELRIQESIRFAKQGDKDNQLSKKQKQNNATKLKKDQKTTRPLRLTSTRDSSQVNPPSDKQYFSSKPSSSATSDTEDEGHSPKPYMMPSPGPPDSETRSETNDDLPPELSAALNFNPGSSQAQAMLPRIKPKALKVDKHKPCTPSQFPQDVESKIKQLHDLMITSHIIHPVDLAFIRQCLNGNFVKPQHLESDVYSVVLSVSSAETKSQPEATADHHPKLLEMKYFEACFLPNGQSSWDLKTTAVDLSSV
ncbi:hypothetical protein DSO57_1039088 [Entomophthora muscae]|nr:hypothetical protein DSO57_1039088 [Entomophthora muscae]